MDIKIIDRIFSVCKVSDFSYVKIDDDYCFIAKTDEERSVVCTAENIPPNTIARSDGWRAFRIDGMLDFSLIGVLAEIAKLLAENQISIFAVSTYNTDYIMTKEECFSSALSLLRKNGYNVF